MFTFNRNEKVMFENVERKLQSLILHLTAKSVQREKFIALNVQTFKQRPTQTLITTVSKHIRWCEQNASMSKFSEELLKNSVVFMHYQNTEVVNM